MEEMRIYHQHPFQFLRLLSREFRGNRERSRTPLASFPATRSRP